MIVFSRDLNYHWKCREQKEDMKRAKENFVERKTKILSPGQNIFELYNVLVEVQFVASKTNLDIYNNMI